MGVSGTTKRAHFKALLLLIETVGFTAGLLACGIDLRRLTEQGNQSDLQEYLYRTYFSTVDGDTKFNEVNVWESLNEIYNLFLISYLNRSEELFSRKGFVNEQNAKLLVPKRGEFNNELTRLKLQRVQNYGGTITPDLGSFIHKNQVQYTNAEAVPTGNGGGAILINRDSKQIREVIGGERWGLFFEAITPILLEELIHIDTVMKENPQPLNVHDGQNGFTFTHTLGFAYLDPKLNVGFSMLEEASTSVLSEFYYKQITGTDPFTANNYGGITSFMINIMQQRAISMEELDFYHANSNPDAITLRMFPIDQVETENIKSALSSTALDVNNLSELDLRRFYIQMLFQGMANSNTQTENPKQSLALNLIKPSNNIFDTVQIVS